MKSLTRLINTAVADALISEVIHQLHLCEVGTMLSVRVCMGICISALVNLL
jgi:hypothetical protein